MALTRDEREQREEELYLLLLGLFAESRESFEAGDPTAAEQLAARIEEAMADAMTTTYLIAALALAGEHGLSVPSSAQQASAWSAQQAREFASTISRTTAEKVAAARAASDLDAFDEIFSEDRARGIAKTETTRGITGGEQAARDAMRGGSASDTDGNRVRTTLVAYWGHPGHRVPGRHPCPNCADLEGKPEWEWEGINPAAFNGPPLHPNCDCAIEWREVAEEYVNRNMRRSLTGFARFTLRKNCGTGAGGFKPGNTCGKEDGVSPDAIKGSKPRSEIDDDVESGDIASAEERIQAADTAGEPFALNGHEWVRPPGLDHDEYQIILADVAEVDAAWSEGNPTLYIPPGGGGAEIEGRRDGFVQFLESGKPIELPEVSVTGDGAAQFKNGRHRFSVFRDGGMDVMPVLVPRDMNPGNPAFDEIVSEFPDMADDDNWRLGGSRARELIGAKS